MNTDNSTLRKISLDRSGQDSDKIWKKFGKISTYLLSSSSPMSKTEKIGLSITVIAFGMILTPLALSDSDPYHLKWLFDEVKETVPLIDNTEKNHDSQYRVIAHLKISNENHIDATEKIILGKYRSFAN